MASRINTNTNMRSNTRSAPIQNIRNSLMFSTREPDQTMIEAPRSSTFDFIMKNLQAFYLKHHANNPELRPYIFGGLYETIFSTSNLTTSTSSPLRDVIKDFVDFLRASERLVAYRRNVNDITSNESDYFCFKIQVEVPSTHNIVNIDLVTHSRRVAFPFKLAPRFHTITKAL